MIETAATFACFGGTCAVSVLNGADASDAVAFQRARLLAWHAQFTRFDAGSELSRLNADPREVVPVSEDMLAFAAAATFASELTSGLVDATLIGALEERGYRADPRAPLPLALALRLAPARRPARAEPAAAWRRVEVDRATGTLRRPLGLRLDSGGIAKGLCADFCAADLEGHAAYAVDCAGDLRVGGLAREVRVASPFDGSVLHSFVLTGAAVATSGIGARSWLDAAGRAAHHLLDPSTGAPAFTGVVQATAVAPTGVEAEARAKAAVLAGPERAAAWLAHGGVIVRDDGSTEVVALAAVGGDGVDDRVAADEVQDVEVLAQLPGLGVAQPHAVAHP